MKISIITVCFNNRAGLKRTIDSVLAQTKADSLEYIIIDGGSNDGSKELIKKHDSHITYWCSEPDNGIYHAMNKALPHATGDYLLFLNSGDFLYSNDTIEQTLPELATGEDFVFGREITYPGNQLTYDDVNIPLTMLDFYIGAPIPHNACFIKKSVFNLLKYDERYRIVSDWKFFMEGIIIHKLHYKNIPQVITRFEENGISSDRNNCMLERNEVLNELFPPAVLKDFRSLSLSDTKTATNYSYFFNELWINNRKMAKLIYKSTSYICKVLSYRYNSFKFAKKFCHLRPEDPV